MPKKVDNYDNERKSVLDKMFSILGINENNNKFLLHELDTNEEKQKLLLDLEPDIKKYFICSKWSCFKDPEMKRKALSYFKHVLKEMGLNIMITTNVIKDNNDSKKRKIYHIVKNI